MRIKSIFTAIVIATATTTILAESKTELLPEVKEILEVNFDEKNIDQNAYAALIAIDAPANLDYLAIGKEIVADSIKILRESETNNDYKLGKHPILPQNYYQQQPALDSGNYSFPCENLANYDCIGQLLNDKTQVQQLLINDQILLMRYDQILSLPIFNTPPATLSTPFPDYKIVLDLTRLRLSKAIFMIEKGQVNEGLDIIQQEISFAKRVLAGDSSLIDQMIMIRQLLTTYHTVSELLDMEQMAEQLNNPKLLKLLEPLSKQEQQALVRGFKAEREGILRLFPTFFSEDQIDTTTVQSLIKEFNLQDVILTYDVNATLNAAYLAFKPVIEAASLTLPEASMNYLSHVGDKSKKEQIEPLQLIEKYGKDNIVGGILVEIALADYRVYQYRLYNVGSYLALVNVKLMIKQQAISKEQIPSFLVQLGEKAENPYTKKAFQWDADKQILYSNWLADHAMGKNDGKQPSVYIKFE